MGIWFCQKICVGNGLDFVENCVKIAHLVIIERDRKGLVSIAFAP
jgi:hypothetical protein